MRTRRLVARVLALGAGAALVVSAFSAWDERGAVGIDVRVHDAVPVSVGLLLVAIAAVPALGAVFGARPLPQLVGAVLCGAVVLTWLGLGTMAALTPGVLLAMAAAVVWLHGAAISGR